MPESEAYNFHGTIVTKVNCLLENISTEKTMKTAKWQISCQIYITSQGL